MDYASTNLGVQHASEFESPLGHKGFGPDILSQIPDASLTALGLSDGDALHLKNGSQKWWNGPNVKWKLSDTEQQESKRKNVWDFCSDPQCHYEYWFPEGGGQ